MTTCTCPACNKNIASNEESTLVGDERFHAACAAEINADLADREAAFNRAIFEGMDVREDDNACDFEF